MAGDESRDGPGSFGGPTGPGGLGGFGGPGGLGGLGDPAALGALFGRLQRIFSAGDEGPVSWTLAHDEARQAVAGDDPAPTAGERDAVEQAGRLAELWLDEATGLSSTGLVCEAWSRARWVEATIPTWRTLVTPVATRMSTGMSSALGGQGQALPPGVPPELGALLASAAPMMERLGGGLLGMQLGQAVGALAREAAGSTDLGLPLSQATMALLPATVRATAAGLQLGIDDVRLFLALREAAHARLFAGVPWLAPRLLGAVEAYAAGIDVDTSKLTDIVQGLDPADPGALQEALASGVLEPEDTPAQRAAIVRIETLLALVEGWVETVVEQAAGRRLDRYGALAEAARRRRATGSTAEKAFGTLVGIELRPRRMSEAAQ